MDFEVVGRCIASLPKIFWWKIKYVSRLKMPWVQSFGRYSELCIKKGSAAFGRETVSRSGLNVRVEGGRLQIGEKCFFNTNCSITCMEEIVIGDWCRIANNVVIVDHDHNKQFDGGFTKAAVQIGHHTWIGANCVILKGAEIGSHCIIGANSVVKGKIGDGEVYYRK